MCNKKSKICLIDLGWAVHKDYQPYKGHPTGERSFKVLKEIQDENVEVSMHAICLHASK